MENSFVSEALCFYRLHDTKLYNTILELNKNDLSFLQSSYFSYDYSRNSYYCPKTVLTFLEQLRADEILNLSGFEQVGADTNIQPLAFSHKKMQPLLQQEILAAKNESGYIIIFKKEDPLFTSGIFEPKQQGFLYLDKGLDRFALSQSLTKEQIFLLDTQLNTEFSIELGYKLREEKKGFCIFVFIKELFKALSPQTIRV